MFHHLPNEPGVGPDCLVRSSDFVYRNIRDNPDDAKQGHPVASFVESVSQSGYKRQGAGGYLKRSLPPLEFEYSEAQVDETVREIDPDSLENLPYGWDGSTYQWVDLDGEGISGVLTEQAGAWFYKPNLGGGRFGSLEVVAERPSLAALRGGRQQLLDLAGDGQLDLVEFGGPTPGFFERREDQNWDDYTPFEALPNIAWDAPNLRFVDLDGDGHADVLITQDEVFTWLPSLAERGFAPAQRVSHPLDEETGPQLVFADRTQSVYLSDMSGDGLTDLVRIRNGEVCYWPSLGYGRFGAKVAMDGAPRFDSAEQFDQRRVRLADIDGSGNTDIIYLGGDGARLYFNESGNRWSEPHALRQFPPFNGVSSVTVVDLLGNGTACLAWSSPLPDDVRRPTHYIALMGAQKPHLLTKLVNNLGAETVVRYAPSTRFYLEDKVAEKPWITRLPFPVHVVERVDAYDRISRNRFVTRYAYHHGYFDGIEREFRGFGLVEQWDTEEFAALSASGAFPDATNIDSASHVPPVLTKTWFHTGAYSEVGRVSKQFEHEYYREGDESDNAAGLTDAQFQAMLLPDTVLPTAIKRQDGTTVPWTLSGDEAREASRALKGSILRQEVFGQDGTEEEDRPYSISERNYTIELLQPQRENRHAVFFAHARETVDFHYERKLYDVNGKKLADPRVSHAVTLEVDGLGNVVKTVAIGYGRRVDDPDPILNADDRAKQKRTLVTHTQNRYTNSVVEDDAYRTPCRSEALTYELLNVRPAASQPAVTNLFRFEELRIKVEAAGDGLHDLPYEDVVGAGAAPRANEPYRRIIEHVRTLYMQDDLSGLLPLGALQSTGLPGENYKVALTPGLLNVFAPKIGLHDLKAILSNEAKYGELDGDGHWWIPSGRVSYSPEGEPDELSYARRHLFLPRRHHDSFGHTTHVAYDSYDLLVLETRDPLGNRTTAGERDPTDMLVTNGNDYRVLQPVLVMDPNRNRVAVAFDALGAVVGTATMGKPEENLGDSLAGFDPDLTAAVIAAHLQDPLGNPHEMLQGATTRIVYDPFAYKRTSAAPQPQPTVAYTLARETHDADLPRDRKTRVQHNFTYSDGLGREIQQKLQAEPGPLNVDDPDAPVVTPRWVGSGWRIFNNKGKPVRQYEPFFGSTHHFEFAKSVGVSPVLFHDPVERVVATLYPNRTYDKVVFDPWRQVTWDVNDTVLQTDPKDDADVGGFFGRLDAAEYVPSWYTDRQGGAQGPEEQSAARKAAVHARTPTTAYCDGLGRVFLTLAHNRFEHNGGTVEQKYATRVELDIDGHHRAVVDAKGRLVVAQEFDMLASKIRVRSADAGETLTLLDSAGKAIRSWDSRDQQVRIAYDPLRRPTRLYARRGAQPEQLIERTIYGEAHPNAPGLNLRTRYHQHYDGAGVVTSEVNDFKGNALRTNRRLAKAYKEVADWTVLDGLSDAQVIAAPPEDTLESGSLATATTYDAHDRPIAITTPDGSVIRPAYNDAHLLERIEASLRGSASITLFVTNIDYNAKGQRTLIEFGNGVRTEYKYDPKTFRPIQLLTTRGAAFPDDCPNPPNPPCGAQNLHYTYDPSGNVTHIRDDAQQTIYFRNRRVEPSAEYTYDALYRLIAAAGREHLGQAAGGATLPPAPTGPSDVPRIALLHPNDGNAMGRYLQEFQYDEVGNILQTAHRGTDPAHPGWSRGYTYDAPSSIEPGKTNNRLTHTLLGDGTSEAYAYDAHGNTISMSSLSQMDWDFKDRLQVADLGGGGKAYFVYDANGQRVRKVVASQNGARQKERIYVGSYEVYREYNGNDASLERETLHVLDDTRRVAIVETRTKGDDGSAVQLIRYQFDNHLGTACLELDDQARIISYEEYYPFGSTSYQAVRSRTETPKRYRSTGKERDTETGLYYHGARYYAPWVGRWISVDPAGLIDGVNVYAYVRNNPVNFSDPTGHLTWGQWAGIAAAVVVGTVLTVATAGLAGPVVGTAAAAIIGGIVGGAAGGAVAEVTEAAVDHRPITAANVGRAALIGGIAGGVFAGIGVGASALARSAVGRAVASRVASSAVGQTTQQVARFVASRLAGSALGQAARRTATRLAQSSVGRAVSGVGGRAASVLRTIHEVSERAGEAVSRRIAGTPAARAAASFVTGAAKVGPAASIPEDSGAFLERGVFGRTEGTTYLVRAGVGAPTSKNR